MDGDGAGSAGDEYLWRVSTYCAGKVDLDYREASIYVGDRIRAGRMVDDAVPLRRSRTPCPCRG